MSILTRDQILNAVDLSVESVDVPEWGGVVLVRTLTGEQRDAYEASIVRQNGRNTQFNLVNLHAMVVALCVVEQPGTRLFSDADVKLLAQKSAAALQRVFEVAQRRNGLREEDIDELGKASLNGPHGDS